MLHPHASLSKASSSPIPIQIQKKVRTPAYVLGSAYVAETAEEGLRLRYECATWAMYKLITEARRRMSYRSLVAPGPVYRPTPVRPGVVCIPAVPAVPRREMTFQSEDAIFELEL